LFIELSFIFIDWLYSSVEHLPVSISAVSHILPYHETNLLVVPVFSEIFAESSIVNYYYFVILAIQMERRFRHFSFPFCHFIPLPRCSAGACIKHFYEGV
jgi:TRAP-type mannitol/chloroaromatic compound transport system permease large subunit